MPCLMPLMLTCGVHLVTSFQTLHCGQGGEAGRGAANLAGEKIRKAACVEVTGSLSALLSHVTVCTCAIIRSVRKALSGYFISFYFF